MFPLFATGFVDTDGKFAAGIKNTSGPYIGGKFAAGVVDTGGAPCKYLRQFSKKIEMTLMLGEDDSRKKPEAKNLATLCL